MSHTARPEFLHNARAGLSIMYGESFASEGLRALSAASDSQQLYIVGCLLLNLTASVNPGCTRFEERLRINQEICSSSSSSSTLSAAAAQSIAAAGLSWTAGAGGGGGSFSCFHCNARVTLQIGPAAAGSPPDPWERHRKVSAACYYVRLRDFVAASSIDGSRSSRQQLTPSVSADVEKYRRALRKLRRDLAEFTSLRMAEQFGYSARSVAFAATRHFMLNGGAVPDRAGDMIACLHSCQQVFDQQVLECLDVTAALNGLAGIADQQLRLQHQQQQFVHCSS